MTCIAPDYATSDPAWTPLLPTRARDFTSFAAAVRQVEDTRIYAGFRFRFSCVDGATLGAQVARYVTGTLMQPRR